MQAGDLIFAHSKGIIGKAIRFGELFRGGSKGSKWNHVAILDRPTDNGDWYIIQAEAKGVTNDKLLSSIAPGGHYEVVPLPLTVQHKDVLEFARGQVGAKYGIITILSCVLDILLPDAICLRRAHTWICSGLVAGALLFAGYQPALKWAEQDLYTMTPKEVYNQVTS